MKKSIIKDSFRRIWKTRGRFFAIMAIVAIGSGFFAGVKVTSPDMKKTADKYYKDQNLMDIRLVSTFGFDDYEMELISQFDDVSGISGGYSADMLIDMEDGTAPVVKVYSINTSLSSDSENYISRPQIVRGRMPENPYECLIEKDTPSVYDIGDKIKLKSGNEEKDTDEILSVDTFTVVGEVTWVKYVDFERGTTTVGNGSIGSFLIVPDEAFAYEYYTDIYLTLSGSDTLYSFDDEYQDYIDAWKEKYEEKTEEIHKSRLDDIRAELNDAAADVEKGENDYKDGVDEYNTEIADAIAKIEDAKKEISDVEEEIKENSEKYEDGMKKYESAKEELEKNRKTITDQRSEYRKGKEEEKKLRQLYTKLDWFIDEDRNRCIEEQDPVLMKTVSEFEPLDTPQLSVSQLAYMYAVLPVDSDQKNEACYGLIQVLNGLSTQIDTVYMKLSAANTELLKAEAQIKDADRQLEDTYKELVSAKEQLEDGKIQIEDAKTELAENEAEFSDKRQEGLQKLEDAKKELDDGKIELADAQSDFNELLDGLKWYVFDRNSNNGYSSFGEDADRIDSIAKIFPIFFILIAALVCLNTMSRMVEEQRTEIGTLKALGYGNASIMMQYVFYAFLASIIGVAVGLSVGFKLFPVVIFNAYRMMYQYPDVICEFRWDYAAGCLAASLACTCLSAASACMRELRVQPAQLMRPKPPKNGKRVILEYIPFLWKHMGFNMKITARNLFRYKKRVLMTVIGIGGCTALMLTGFGLRNAITVIVDKQFGEIQTSDAMCAFSYDEETYSQLYDNIYNMPDADETIFLLQKSVTALNGSQRREAYAVVPEDPARLNDFINLRDRKDKTVYHLEGDGVIINEKLAKLLGVSAGDEIGFEDSDEKAVITAITENYSQHYIYFTPETFTRIFGKYDNNMIYIDLRDGFDKDSVSAEILKNDDVMAVNFLESSGNTFRKLVDSLNIIVLVIIGSSGALAFVVLYNLSNINITERMRELATIKVLGFYDGEVSAYIYRESTVSSLLGMAVGLFGGIFLNDFVIKTSEVDVVMFYPDIPAYCFVCAAVLTLLFTVIVNVLMHFKLRNIDMAASMKAIE